MSPVPVAPNLPPATPTSSGERARGSDDVPAEAFADLLTAHDDRPQAADRDPGAGELATPVVVGAAAEAAACDLAAGASLAALPSPVAWTAPALLWAAASTGPTATGPTAGPESAGSVEGSAAPAGTAPMFALAPALASGFASGFAVGGPRESAEGQDASLSATVSGAVAGAVASVERPAGLSGSGVVPTEPELEVNAGETEHSLPAAVEVSVTTGAGFTRATRGLLSTPISAAAAAAQTGSVPDADGGILTPSSSPSPTPPAPAPSHPHDNDRAGGTDRTPQTQAAFASTAAETADQQTLAQALVSPAAVGHQLPSGHQAAGPRADVELARAVPLSDVPEVAGHLAPHVPTEREPIRMVMRLDPPELGHLTIVMRRDALGLHVHVQSEAPLTSAQTQLMREAASAAAHASGTDLSGFDTSTSSGGRDERSGPGPRHRYVDQDHPEGRGPRRHRQLAVETSAPHPATSARTSVQWL